jgi:DNA-binding NarL/FixJ family response regulator
MPESHPRVLLADDHPMMLEGLRTPLTPRETDIVRLVGKGLGNKEIASKLGVSVTTVRSHLNSVYDKLGPASRVELALLAARRP